VATIQAFRVQVQQLAAIAIHGTDYGSAAKRVHREARSGYSEDLRGPFKQTFEVTTVDSLAIFQVDPNRAIDALQAGEKCFQLRVWAVEIDTGSDVNVSPVTAAVEIEVHRRMADRDEEYLYTSDEMLADMLALLDPDLWTGAAAVDALLEGPSIDAVPEIENDILRYTVAFQATVTPD
jgi:hypothetical protein